MVTEAYQFGAYFVEVYDDPSFNLCQSLQDDLAQECMSVAKNAFGDKHIDEEVVRRRVLRTSTSIVIRNEFDQIVGIGGSTVQKIDGDIIIYLQGATISKKFQDNGLYKLIMYARIIAGLKKIYEKCMEGENILIGGRTQSPLVYRFMHKKLGVFPYPNGYINEKIKYTAKRFAKYVYLNYSDFQPLDNYVFDENTFVLRKSFKSSLDGKENGLNLYGHNIPFCKGDNDINQYMIQNLNWSNGDALIMLGYYRQKDVEALFDHQKPELTPSVAAGVLPSLALSSGH